MELRIIDLPLTVCKVSDIGDLDLSAGFYFIGRTDEEISLVCETAKTPRSTTAREDGWRAFGICGKLDFSLVGLLSKISGVLAEGEIGIFAVSTYNTDYILVKEDNFDRAARLLEKAGYEFR